MKKDPFKKFSFLQIWNKSKEKKCALQWKISSEYLFQISNFLKNFSGLDFMYYMQFLKAASFQIPLKWFIDPTFPNCLILRIKFHFSTPKTQRFCQKINTFFWQNFFLPLYVTRSNCTYLFHNQDFCFCGSKSIFTVCKKILLLICATRTKWITGWMESNIYSKFHQPEHHRFHSSTTQPSRHSAGTMNPSGFGLMP